MIASVAFYALIRSGLLKSGCRWLLLCEVSTAKQCQRLGRPSASGRSPTARLVDRRLDLGPWTLDPGPCRLLLISCAAVLSKHLLWGAPASWLICPQFVDLDIANEIKRVSQGHIPTSPISLVPAFSSLTAVHINDYRHARKHSFSCCPSCRPCVARAWPRR